MKQKLSSFFPNWMDGGGVFSKMNDVPWNDSTSASLLDLEYFGNHSGGKIAAPLLHALSSDGVLSESAISTLANMLMRKFASNWNRLWVANTVDYNITDSYRMNTDSKVTTNDTEVGEHSETNTGNNSNNQTIDVKNEETRDLVKDEIVNRYGFNSTEAEPYDSRNIADKGSDTTTNTGTAGVTGEFTETRGGNNQKTNSGTRTTVEEITGNIGSFPYQQLVRQERELWMDSFFETVFAQVDSVLATPAFYEEE